MNKELLKRLKQEAQEVIGEGLGGNYYSLDEDKFAELIVRECARIARKEQDWNDTHEIQVNIDQCILCDFGLK